MITDTVYLCLENINKTAIWLNKKINGEPNSRNTFQQAHHLLLRKIMLSECTFFSLVIRADTIAQRLLIALALILLPYTTLISLGLSATLSLTATPKVSMALIDLNHFSILLKPSLYFLTTLTTLTASPILAAPLITITLSKKLSLDITYIKNRIKNTDIYKNMLSL